MSSLRLYLIGPPRIERDGVEVEFERRKNVALLAYLAVTGQPHTREALITLLWPELEPTRARAGLRRNLSALRKALGEEWLVVGRETVSLAPDADVWIDVHQFRQQLAACESHRHNPTEVCLDCVPLLEESAALYRGDFLEGFTLPDSAAFDEFEFFQAEELRRELTSTLQRLVRIHSTQGAYEAAISYSRRWLRLDPLHEPAHRRLMELYAHAGQRSAALRQYEECVRMLEEEMGLLPAEETTSLYEQIRTGIAEGERPLTTPIRPRHNLPTQTTPFIGREIELAAIEALLNDPDCRLLTLVGPGGCGKTWLALEAAAAQLDRFEHGVFFVSLAPLRSAEGIVSAVAQAIGFSLYAGDEPQQQLLNYLRQRQMLLVLDNFEHVMDGVELVSAVLENAPEVKLLVTSRARLNLHPEHLLAVAGMDYPRAAAVKDASAYSAIKLFLDAASRVRPDFELTTENGPDVVRICHLVDGIPLGIVLAAGWLRMLTPTEINTQINKSLDFLETDLRDLPQRQRSVRVVFDRSWNLLTERQQEVFRALSVFRGGFTDRAAEQVADASLRDLKGLVDRSLVQRAPTSLYEVQGLLRQYAEEKLGQNPEVAEAIRDRHSAYYLLAAQQWWEDAKGPGTQIALDEMEAEFQNVRAAWDWAAEREHIELLDRALEGLCEFCWARAWNEGPIACRVAAEKLSTVETLTPDGQRVLARLLIRQANYHGWSERKELGDQLVQQGLQLLERLELAGSDVRRERAYGLLTKGEVISSNRGEKRRLLKQSLALYKGVGDRWWTAFVLLVSGQFTDQCEEKEQLGQQSLAIARDLGEQRLISQGFRVLWQAALQKWEFETAERLIQGALQAARGIDNQVYIAGALSDLGRTLAYRGQHAESHSILKDYWVISNDLGFHHIVADSRLMLSYVKAHLGRYEEARALAQVDLARELGDDELVADYLSVVGKSALAVGEHAKARELLQESIAIERDTNAEYDLARDLLLLGYAAYGLGESLQARQYFSEALKLVAAFRTFWRVMHMLPLAALLLADRGETERAVEIYALALNYPFVANSQWFEDVAGKQIAAVAATLPPDVVAAAQERGRARDVDATVAELLAEFGE